MIITNKLFQDFTVKYFETQPQYLRYGQAFCNYFRIQKNDLELKLFYEKNTSNAMDIIINNYIDKEVEVYE